MDLLNTTEYFQDNFGGRVFFEKTFLDFYFYYEFICPMVGYLIGFIICLGMEVAKRLGYT
jgi:hypothetical protein